MRPRKISPKVYDRVCILKLSSQIMNNADIEQIPLKYINVHLNFIIPHYVFDDASVKRRRRHISRIHGTIPQLSSAIYQKTYLVHHRREFDSRVFATIYMSKCKRNAFDCFGQL